MSFRTIFTRNKTRQSVVSLLRLSRHVTKSSQLSVKSLSTVTSSYPSSSLTDTSRAISQRHFSVCSRYDSNSTMTRQDSPNILAEKITNVKDISNSNKQHRTQSTSAGTTEKAGSDKKNSIATRTYDSFQTMASIQKLATEPSREHIENIRKLLKHTNAKNNNDQQITLEKDDISGIGTICIRSAARNGISAKMMCDFLDTIDELYSWQEGKGVIIYGHEGFFCSGKQCIN